MQVLSKIMLGDVRRDWISGFCELLWTLPMLNGSPCRAPRWRTRVSVRHKIDQTKKRVAEQALKKSAKLFRLLVSARHFGDKY